MAVVSNGTTIISGGALASGFGGTLILLSTQTASNSATISFTTGLDSTYDAYEFHFINCKTKSSGYAFSFNGSTDSGSNYNVTKTTTTFSAQHSESDATATLGYIANFDIAQGTGFQQLGYGDGSTDADGSLSGTLTLFNPSSTTYVKHFICTANQMTWVPISENAFTAGYFNTTSAINAIQFKMTGGNFDGDIKLYGVKKS